MRTSVFARAQTAVVVASVVLLAFASVAWAAVTFFMTGGGTWTAVSGLEHVYSSTYAPNSSRSGVSGFTFWEFGDDPMAIQILTTKLCTDNCKATDTHQIATEDDFKILSYAQTWTVKADTDHYITAVQVCLNNTDDAAKRKIKGLKVWGARIDSSGKLQYDKEANSHELPNCYGWSSIVSCPDGKVATGIRAHWVSGKAGFAGIALYCAGLKEVMD